MRSHARTRSGCPLRAAAGVVALALMLGAGSARAADVAVLSWTQSSATQTRTLRIPRTGSFTVPAASSGYLVVAVAVPDIRLAVGSATWTSTAPRAGAAQALVSRVSRPAGDETAENCR